MKNLILYLKLTLFSMVVWNYGSAKDDFLSLLPDNAVFLMEVDDLKEFSESIESGPLGEFSKSKAWDTMKEWAEDEWQNEMKNESENIEIFLEHLQEWTDNFSGGAVLGIWNLEKIFSKKMPNMSLLIKTDSTTDQLEETLKLMKKEVASSGGKSSWELENIKGQDVHWIGTEKDKEKNQRLAIVLFDKTLGIFISGEDHVKETLMRRAGESPSDSMVKNVNYLDLFEEIERGAARIFLNFEPLRSLMEKAESLPGMQIPENPFGITTSKLISGLGLDSLECLGIQIDPSDDKLVLSSGAFFSHYDGIFSFMQHEEEGEVIPYDFIPNQAFSATSARYNFALLWPTVEKIVSGLSPQLLLLMNSQIQAFEEQAGVAFRRDVLGSLGDEAVSFSLLNGKAKTIEDFEKANPSFYGISLTNSKLFDRSLRSMIDSFAPGNELFKDRVHKGVTIRKLRGLEESGVSLSYAVTDKWFFLAMGEDNQLNQMINRLQGKGRSLWKNKEVQKTLADLPDGVRQLDYMNLERLVEFLVPIAISSIESEGEFELSADDFPQLPYFLLAWSKNVKRGIIGKGELYPISGK
jgi:hypothetical protein